MKKAASPSSSIGFFCGGSVERTSRIGSIFKFAITLLESENEESEL